jgi:hypothetical protein
MKRILFPVLILLSAVVFGQQISDFRYITLTDAKDFANDKFGLNSLLSAKLQAKGYTVLGTNRQSWPADAASDPCSVLQADVENISSLLKNKLMVSFNDCKGKSVGTFEGRSNIKEYEAGYQDALSAATNIFPAYNPVARNSGTSAAPAVVKEEGNSGKTTAKSEESAPALKNSAQTYSNGSSTLNRIIISETEFILANPKNSVPYAIFRESTRKGVFRVQLQDGSKTLGYTEESNIVIEKATADGSFSREVFRQIPSKDLN